VISPGRKAMRTACTYDCPDACSLLAAVTETGELELAGDPGHPITRGFLCPRIKRHGARLQSPRRLRAPLRRDGGGNLREVSWDEALDAAASALSEAVLAHGSESIVLVGGGGSLGVGKKLIAPALSSLGPLTTLRGGACGEAGEAAQVVDFGAARSHDYLDLAHSKAIVLFGKNPVATGVHLVPQLTAARKRSVEVVLIEPRSTESDGQATRRIRIRAGADGLLALGVLRLLWSRGRLAQGAIARSDGFDRVEELLGSSELEPERCARACGVEPEDLEWLARLYSEHRPVATWIGWGLQRRGAGGHSVRCIDALALLTGQVGVSGGGVSFTSKRSRGLDLAGLSRPAGRMISTAHFGRELAALEGPPAQVAYVACANPVTQLPESRATAEALRKVPTTIVVDAFLTDTAETADLVLPVALMLEEDDIVGSYQHHHVAVVHKILEAPPQVKTDTWILAELLRRIGKGDEPVLADPRATLEAMAVPWFPGVQSPFDGEPGRNPTQVEIPYAESFDTPTGKARLVDTLPRLASAPPGFPLSLLTTSSRAWQTSQLPEENQAGPARCHVHPEAVAALGLGDGDRARLSSPIGTMDVEVRLDEGIQPELCVVHRGGWVRHGRGVNVLIEARETDLGDGVAFYDQWVRIDRLEL